MRHDGPQPVVKDVILKGRWFTDVTAHENLWSPSVHSCFLPVVSPRRNDTALQRPRLRSLLRITQVLVALRHAYTAATVGAPASLSPMRSILPTMVRPFTRVLSDVGTKASSERQIGRLSPPRASR